MHYEIALWLVGSWSCSGRHNNFSVHIWSVNVVKRGAYVPHSTMTTEERKPRDVQACTLSDTAGKTKGQRCPGPQGPSNLCSSTSLHILTPARWPRLSLVKKRMLNRRFLVQKHLHSTVSVARWQGACLRFGNADSPLPLDLLKKIRLVRAHLWHDELLHRKQTTIDVNFGFR